MINQNPSTYYPTNMLGGVQIPPNPISFGMNGYNNWPNQPSSFAPPAQPNPALMGMGGYYSGNYYNNLLNPFYNQQQEELKKQKEHAEKIAESWKIMSRSSHRVLQDMTEEEIEESVKQYDPKDPNKRPDPNEYKCDSTMVISVVRGDEVVIKPKAVKDVYTAYVYMEEQNNSAFIGRLLNSPNIIVNGFGSNVNADHQKITEAHNKIVSPDAGFIEFSYAMKDLYIAQLKERSKEILNVGNLYDKELFKGLIEKSRGTKSFYGGLYAAHMGQMYANPYSTLTPTGTFSSERAKALNLSDMAVTLPDHLKSYEEKKRHFIDMVLAQGRK